MHMALVTLLLVAIIAGRFAVMLWKVRQPKLGSWGSDLTLTQGTESSSHVLPQLQLQNLQLQFQNLQ